jgi:transcriptional regulator with XRE-family HTH domain
MASNVPNVLRVNSVEEQTRYRNAVSQILLDIQQEHNLTLADIAETIDVSLGTISNAANKKNDLSVTYLARLGERFGPEMLNPYAALYGGRMVPLSPSNFDALPSLTASVHSIAVARSPNSEGGERTTHRELLSMLPDLKAAQAAITNLILQAEGVRAA